MINIRVIILSKFVYLLLFIYCSCILYRVWNIITYKQYIKISILFVFPVVGNHGPATLATSYIKTINILSKNKYIKNHFKLTAKRHISLKDYQRYVDENKYNIIWFLFSDYFYLLNNDKFKLITNNTIYGPMVSPRKWFLFPLNGTYEANWSKCINKIFAYVVQSERVKLHLIKHSQHIKNIDKKYLVSHGCLISNQSEKITPWKKRNYDILIYSKFADQNKEIHLQKLIKLLKDDFKYILIKYGNHTKESLKSAAMNSKILIYFSFYDCWPSSLMEMENLGIYPIVHQCEFIDTFGKCIKDMHVKLYELIIVLKSILLKTYKSSIIAKHYIKRNNCLSTFKQTLFEIYYRKIKYKLILL